MSGSNESLKNPEIHVTLEKLRQIAESLRSLGFTINERVISYDELSQPTASAGFPIEVERNIRASYSRDRGLRIWFTNEFQEPSHPKRLEVIQKLKEQGLWNTEN